ncbi:hypothetical protein EYR38_010747 [Pleurotus pulmonarius]|nr:hypothetical protein EYR38_010747 [Pleurotus pulmonarius]
MPIHARQLDVPECPASPLGEPILQQSSAEMQAGCDAVEAELFASLRRLVISDQPRNRGPSSPVDDPDPAPPYYVVNPPPEFSRTARTFYVVCHGCCCGVYTDWPYVNSLVSGIGNRFKKYKNISAARRSYLDNKARGTLVVERRSLQDYELFGPVDEAYDDPPVA